jgi:hypothetical protein
MKILSNAEYKRLTDHEFMVRRIGELYWLSEFQWLVGPVKDYLVTGRMSMHNVREQIRSNKQKVQDLIETENANLKLMNQQLRYELDVLKSAIKIIEKKGFATEQINS